MFGEPEGCTVMSEQERDVCIVCSFLTFSMHQTWMNFKEKVATSKLMEQGPCRISELFCPTSPLRKNELTSPESQARVSAEDLHSAFSLEK